MSGGAARDYERLWQHAPGGHLLLDDDGVVVDVNTTFLRWTGHARDAVVGTRFARLLPVGDRVLWSTRCLPQLGVSGRVDEASVQVLGADGARRPALLSAARDERGEVSVVLVDAAQRRRHEGQLLAERRAAEEARARTAAEEARWRELVHRDALTGLLNRAGVLHALDGLHALGAAVTVLFVDLDGFKAVNDSLGHASGDELLRVVAGRLSGTWRAGAPVARLAGDEFVLLDVLDPEQVAPAAARVVDVLVRPVVLQGLEVVLGASVGAATAGPGTEGDPVDGAAELLLRRADAAMYRAKAAGGGRVVVHRPGDPDPGADRLVLLEQLRTALREDQLRVHYQPRVDLADGRVRGVEALVRWEHPVRGLLAPAHFIEEAERSGIVRDLGGWVLERAVAQVAAWRAEGVADLQLSVNVSARQLLDPTLVTRVAAALARSGLSPAALVLEITETALMAQPETALATLHQLKGLGVALAVDDFGTGYSSFTYLKRFPVDELKVDRSFVAGLGGGPGGAPADPGDAAIVASCVHLAHAMGLTAVAEGVETLEQCRALAAVGCDQAQGYLFSRPVPAEELGRLLRARDRQRLTA